MMKRPVLVILCLVVFASQLRAQQSDVHQQTTAPAGARYEIIQSELAAKWTFRLDRFTGRVAQLVRTKDEDNAWEHMEVIGLPTIAAPSRPHFQLFTSGLAAKHTFLIDTDTGKTWMVITAKRNRTDGTEYEVSLWQPFTDQ